MFYALSLHEDFWAERLNGFIALAPVTRIDNTTALMFKYTAGLGKAFIKTLNSVDIYNFFVGPSGNEISSLTCRLLPGLCVFWESIVISNVPSD